MPTTITMPQLGETVTEGTVAQWLKKVGDVVDKYEAFVEVSTDKVNAEVPSPVSGTIRELIVSEGQTVPTGAPIAIIDEVGAAAATPSGAHGGAPHADVATVPSSYGAPGSTANGSTANTNGSAANAARGDLRGASPAVRRLAREHAVDISALAGTGANGRVTARDVIAAATARPSDVPETATALAAPATTFVANGSAARPPAAANGATSVPENPSTAVAAGSAAMPSPSGARATYATAKPGDFVPHSQARRIIAQRMVESKHTAPHAWTMVEVDVTDLWRRRSKEKDAFEAANGVRLTVLPFFMRAVVESLAAFPLMNATFTPEGIEVHRAVHLGIAVAVDGNLLVPVIRDADRLTIKGLALAAGEIIDKARRGKLGPDQLSGGTFTVNNTGANGSVLSAPILVGGQAGIVTMEAVVKRPVVRADDAIAVRSMMNVCLSLDHRVVDGAVASGFLSDLKKRLEAPGPYGPL